MEKITAISDKTLGVLSGRDCIYLDTLTQDEFGNLTFKGEINGSLVENPQSAKWLPYTLKFGGVIAYFSCETDTYYNIDSTEEKSSFTIIEKSKWLSELPIRDGEDKKKYTHYRLYTYDFIYNIVAKSYEMNLNI